MPLDKRKTAAVELSKACYFNNVADVIAALEQTTPTDTWINEQVSVARPVMTSLRKLLYQAMTSTHNQWTHFLSQLDKTVICSRDDCPGRTTSLCIACRYAGISVVKVLVRHGADVTVANSSGNTCLHRACRSRRDALDKVLERQRSRSGNI